MKINSLLEITVPIDVTETFHKVRADANITVSGDGRAWQLYLFAAKVNYLIEKISTDSILSVDIAVYLVPDGDVTTVVATCAPGIQGCPDPEVVVAAEEAKAARVILLFLTEVKSGG